MADVSEEKSAISLQTEIIFIFRKFQINLLKDKGNAALTAGKNDEAIEAYSQAIELDGSNYVLYSNRSAAYLKAGKFLEALQDAEKTIELNASWPKGYSRKGAVLFALQKYDEAFTAYNKGEKNINNNLQKKITALDVR